MLFPTTLHLQNNGPYLMDSSFFFFNDTATTEIYTLSLHDALPISGCARSSLAHARDRPRRRTGVQPGSQRSEEHTSELQSRLHLVCRLLLEKKKNISNMRSRWIHTVRPCTVDSDKRHFCCFCSALC